jgi:hypothetical protein
MVHVVVLPFSARVNLALRPDKVAGPQILQQQKQQPYFIGLGAA